MEQIYGDVATKQFDWRWWKMRVEGYTTDIYDGVKQWHVDITLLGRLGFIVGFYTCPE